jgi:hypothetical protein
LTPATAALCVVALDKALYGCVEAAALWYEELTSRLRENGFVPNAFDHCVLNKTGKDGKQITIVLHVDDLFVTCETQATLDELSAYLTEIYKEIKTARGRRLDYIGMTFDFRTEGEVRVTMDNCTADIIAGCGVTAARATPAASCLFETRDESPKASVDESEWFHSYVAKVLYLAKRVRPECLTAVAFLSTRVHTCDQDVVTI